MWVVSESWAEGGGPVQNTPPYARKKFPGAFVGGPLALVPLAALQGLRAVVLDWWMGGTNDLIYRRAQNEGNLQYQGCSVRLYNPNGNRTTWYNCLIITNVQYNHNDFENILRTNTENERERDFLTA